MNPPGNPFPIPLGPSIRLKCTQVAIQVTSTNEVGIGNPSKNLDFPVVSLGSNATVALNLANRAIPQQMNVVKAKMSSVERQPMVNARKAGATPKEIYIEQL